MPDADRSPQTLEILKAAAHALARATSLEAGLGRLLAATAEALEAKSGVLLLADPDRAGLAVGATHAVDAGTAEALASAAAGGDHPAALSMARRELIVDGGATYVPLVVQRDGGQLGLGVLAIDRPGRPAPGPTEQAVLEAAADLAAAAIDRARADSLTIERSEWLQRVSHSDPLTGLANARTFGRVLELELARAGRQRGEVSVAIFDVDGLGRMNTEAGHNVGDDVLREVAAVLTESIRLVDTVARWGADEFALIAPGSAGLTVARRVLDAVGAVPVLAGRGVTVSAGLARFPTDGTTGEELLGAAARALSSAKAGGPASISEAVAG